MQAYIEKAMVDLPSLPSAVLSIVNATEKETVNTQEIEELVSAEPGIATKILRVVNSAYFGMPREVSSVSQAILILGLHHVRNLTLSVGVFNALSAKRHGTEKIHRAFWERSFGTAACCSIIARRKRVSLHDQELLFVAGLLRDIGLLFLLSQFSTVYTQILKKSNEEATELKDLEEFLLYTNHAALGGMLADKWCFPRDLTDLISIHEDPGLPMDGNLAAILYVADRLTYCILGSQETGYQAPLSLPYIKWLDMSDAELNGLEEEVRAKVAKVGELLGTLG